MQEHREPVSVKEDEARVLAQVNDRVITEERFYSTYVQHLIQTGRNDTEHERRIHLDNLIDTFLLAGEARRRNLTDESYDTYIARKVKKAVGGRFFETTFLDSIPAPDDREVREAFRKSKEQLVLRHLFFRNPEAAQAAYERLMAGEDFVALANDIFATPAFDSSAGSLGSAGYWDLDDAFAEAAFSLNVGDFSEPVRTRYGWHIIRVDDRIYQPLLTETEYQNRREDLFHRVRTRRLRLEGDRFVRTFMEGLGVEVNEDGIRLLVDAVSRVTGESDEIGRAGLREEEVQAIEEELTPETILATYTLEGARMRFTAGDYVSWLEELPYSEVRHRTVASVGRALRNEVLAYKGFDLGLEKDSLVTEEIAYLGDLYLADRLYRKLQEQASITPTDEEVLTAFERMGYRKPKSSLADYWRIPFETLGEAEKVLRELRAGSTDPKTLAGYEHQRGEELLRKGELGVHLQRAPLQQAMIVGTAGPEWQIVFVESRDVTYTMLEEVRPAIEALLKTRLPVLHLIQELRKEADIEVEEEQLVINNE